MKTVITYGTFDLLHHGHIRLLERAKALGDYLIVGVTADDFDKTRGKINGSQSLMERIEAVRALGIADQIIVEEYEGQKIDDIIKYNVSVFTVGSDWVGTFDYLNAYCQVVYLERTQGVSSSEIRAKKQNLRLGIIGDSAVTRKHLSESQFVNGIEVTAVYTLEPSVFSEESVECVATYEKLLSQVDAVYVASHPSKHFEHIKAALSSGKHVLCESPIAMTENEFSELQELANEKNLVLMDAVKTAYSTAYNRLLLLLKSGVIGKILSVDATCTSLRKIPTKGTLAYEHEWNSLCSWGPTALLPVFQIFGTKWNDVQIASLFYDGDKSFDLFTKINFVFEGAVASVKVGKGIKSEGDLVISGEKGYVYVPAPWWKTDYFEIRYENPQENRRCFYQLNGEGIRNELSSFAKAISSGVKNSLISNEVTRGILRVLELQDSVHSLS